MQVYFCISCAAMLATAVAAYSHSPCKLLVAICTVVGSCRDSRTTDMATVGSHTAVSAERSCFEMFGLLAVAILVQ